MMEPKTSSRHFHNILIALVILVCFSAIFYVYFMPDMSWLGCQSVHVPTHEVCRDICISVLKMPNHTQLVNKTCSTNYTFIRNQITQTEQVTQASAQRDDPDTILLIWMWPFGQSFGFGPCSSLFQIQGCRLTDDRSQFNKAHGVLFHHRDIHQDLSNLPKLPRPPFQKWVWMNMEAPSNSPQHFQMNDLFNLTATYRQDSDIMVPYGMISQTSGQNTNFNIPSKSKLVCWIVSNWNSNYKRSHYYSELKKHIDIEAYGRHFQRHISDQDYSKLVSSCKFYLSFENSIHKDYITEKLYNPLTLGTVPVALGPPRENYEQFIPGGAFIHVDDFSSPKELADYLKLLDKDEEKYRQYFIWRENFVAIRTSFGLEHACRACDYIRRNKNYKVIKDLSSWYWS